VVGVLGHDFTRQMGQADLAVRLVAARGAGQICGCGLLLATRPTAGVLPGCGPGAAFME
jgi:hypothetical protein